MKSKKWIIILIISFPSLFWIVLESSTINSKKLPFYGPKTLLKTDTVYHSVEPTFLNINSNDTITLRGAFICVFIDELYRKDSYRLDALWEYYKYNFDKIKEIPFVFIFENKDRYAELIAFKSKSNFYFASSTNYSKLHREAFLNKPYFVDSSYFALIDPQQHIRGYYDARYIAELKRMIDEYRHLRIKEEQYHIQKSNEIKQHP